MGYQTCLFIAIAFVIFCASLLFRRQEGIKVLLINIAWFGLLLLSWFSLVFLIDVLGFDGFLNEIGDAFYDFIIGIIVLLSAFILIAMQWLGRIRMTVRAWIATFIMLVAGTGTICSYTTMVLGF